MNKERRISFNEHDAAHIYEMIMEHLCVPEQCAQCERLNDRFKKFIGPKKFKYIEKLIRNNGYCNKLEGRKL